MPNNIPRFIKHTYTDGSSITAEWDFIMDGPWPYLNSVEMITFGHNCPNPAYEPSGIRSTQIRQ